MSSMWLITRGQYEDETPIWIAPEVLARAYYERFRPIGVTPNAVNEPRRSCCANRASCSATCSPSMSRTSTPTARLRGETMVSELHFHSIRWDMEQRRAVLSQVSGNSAKLRRSTLSRRDLIQIIRQAAEALERMDGQEISVPVAHNSSVL